MKIGFSPRHLLTAVRWRWLALLVTSVVLVVLGSLRGRSTRPAALPDLSLTHLDGRSITLSELETPVVFNLWATWCGPCRRELPMMAGMAAQYPEVTFLFVDQRESQRKVSDYLTEQNLNLEWVLLDPKGKLANQFQSRGLPTTLFFDETGMLTQAHLGEISSVDLFNAVADLQKD